MLNRKQYRCTLNWLEKYGSPSAAGCVFRLLSTKKIALQGSTLGTSASIPLETGSWWRIKRLGIPKLFETEVIATGQHESIWVIMFT